MRAPSCPCAAQQGGPGQRASPAPATFQRQRDSRPTRRPVMPPAPCWAARPVPAHTAERLTVKHAARRLASNGLEEGLGLLAQAIK